MQKKENRLLSLTIITVLNKNKKYVSQGYLKKKKIGA